MKEYALRFLVPNCVTWHRKGVRFYAANDEEAIEAAIVLADKIRFRLLAVSFHIELEEGIVYIDQPAGPPFLYRYPNDLR